jgi:hypothetical protein
MEKGEEALRFFNTAGPVDCEEHYCLPPLERFDLDGIMMLIEQKKYFVLHAPRQTGKTTCLMALMKHLNRQGRYACLYANLEMGQASREDIEQGMNNIMRELASRAKIYLDDPYPESLLPSLLEGKAYGTALNQCLTQWASKSDKPLVLLLDEIDALIGDMLISVLRQIRAGYDKRPAYFPQSVILCGVRDVRDYRIHSDKEKAVITGGSAFNIKAESLRLGNFNRGEISRLYGVHTEDTGQPFQPDAMEQIWEDTRGQPWLVNALAYEACFKMQRGQDRSKPITADLISEARENLILRRETHLDQLADKLQEPRVRSVVEPILTGTAEPGRMLEDDIQYVVDLGLIERKPTLTIANAIYKEVIPRTLTATTQDVMAFETHWYVAADGRLDMDKLLTAFQEFFREHSEHWMGRFDYREAGPQLLLQAFLQRIVNSGGRIDREYGLGRKRTDLMVAWPHEEGVQKVVIELKILYKSRERTIAEGLAQTAEYMDRCGTREGHLVIFDRRADRKWEEKIFRQSEQYEGKAIVVWGM